MILTVELQCQLPVGDVPPGVCGQVDLMYVLAFHVLKENFGGFFERAASLFGERGQDQAAPMTQNATAI